MKNKKNENGIYDYVLRSLTLCMLAFCTLAFCTMAFCMTGCSKSTNDSPKGLLAKGVTTEIKFCSSNDRVEEFVNHISDEDRITGDYYDGDVCYNITPDFIKDNTEFIIFKYIKSCTSYLYYDGEIYGLGVSFGGYGLTSVALGDLNGDQQYELYFTCSYGSGIHQSSVLYFDPVTKKMNLIDYHINNSDLLLTTEEDGTLYLSKATVTCDTFVDFTTKADQLIGEITVKDEKVVVEE